MAVIYYGEGEHPSGFIGYRVATTLGDSTEFRQQYFGLAQYSPGEALRLAESLNAKWRADAEAAKRDGLLVRKRPYSGAGVIVMGLRATLKVERGRKAHYGTYITPCFAVTIPGYGRGQKNFLTTTLGFDRAYAEAVDCYCRLHDLSETERAVVLSLKPSKQLFTETLRLGLIRRGITISEAQVEAKLAAKIANRRS
jgi:hypothetical protein